MKLTGTLAEKGFNAFDTEPRIHAGHEIPRTWVIVADRIKAHVYRKTAEGLELIADMKSEVGMPIAEGAQRNLGHIAGTNTYYTSDPRDREHRHDDSEFIRELVTWLENAEREKAFDRLVLVAAPRTLGDIRPFLGKTLTTRITAEIDKDLTWMNEKEIQDNLKDVIWT